MQQRIFAFGPTSAPIQPISRTSTVVLCKSSSAPNMVHTTAISSMQIALSQRCLLLLTLPRHYHMQKHPGRQRTTRHGTGTERTYRCAARCYSASLLSGVVSCSVLFFFSPKQNLLTLSTCNSWGCLATPITPIRHRRRRDMREGCHRPMEPLLALYALQKHKQYQDDQRGAVAESKATCWDGRQLSLEPTVLPSFFRTLHDPIHIVA